MIANNDMPNSDYLNRQTKEYISRAKADNTMRAYISDFLLFIAWCEHYNVTYLPAEPTTIASYISYMAESGRKVSTIQRKISAISQAHQKENLESPTYNHIVRSTMQGIRRTLGAKQTEKRPISIKNLQRVSTIINNDLTGYRDKALLLIGFAGAFRRSELVAIDVEHLTFHTEGVEIFVPKSKTDQEGEGFSKGIEYGGNPDTCPVLALEKWLAAAHITTGMIFRPINRHRTILQKRLTPDSVALLVKKYMAEIGLPTYHYAGHSLRAGLATEAAKAGVKELDIAEQTGHKSLQTLRRYIRKANVFTNNVSGKVGL